jgi:hypothetical protein
MGEDRGPVDSRTLRELAVGGEINRDTFVRRNDGDWITADRIGGLFRRVSRQVRNRGLTATTEPAPSLQ